MSRSVLVTGGNRGIGLATARAFATAGDRVAVTYRSEPPPDANLLALPCDVTSAEQVNAAFDTAEQAHGKVEVLVACAGTHADELSVRMSDHDFDRVLDTNLTGSFRVARRAGRSMLRARRGRMIFFSSVLSNGSAGQANYAASKAAVIAMARSIAAEMGSRGITANVISPGLVTTEMTKQLSDARREQLLSRIPLGRAATPDEIANLVLFLASDAAAVLNGIVLTADGGLSTVL
ncbi:SDR family oxidoreductase [Streptacidiphilus jiangxiensis]|uniref:3-oxoacyl-[acyl-carrier protein] reductase n=1 Tax=Streptacidiphilus jiangxiensis TaxID=235985 RepID=A0A1H7H221_STRJI|nr:SDR family oxidoreductase [Streptacidiphilus jiangxiensis]SEK44339.1 3-oxoacyl-[acyl-carrier protein] reductase [Streptacidiphilus jiangxiensis]